MRSDGLSPAAGALLLDLLEQTEPVITQIALADHFPGAGAELLSRGLLLRHGSSEIVISAEDVPMAVIASPAGDGLGYFSPKEGWQSVPPEMLQCFRVDIPAAIAAIAARIAWSGGLQPVELQDELLWELGDARIARRGPLTSMWFARRLGEPPVAQAISSYVGKRPSEGSRLLLTSTPSSDIGMDGAGLLIIGVRDVLARGAGLAVDHRILTARLTGRANAPPDQPVHLSPDGRSLFIRGEEVLTITGDIQKKIVAKLVKAYGPNLWCSASELLDNAGSESGALHRAFGKQWSRVRPHLENRNGLWRLIA